MPARQQLIAHRELARRREASLAVAHRIRAAFAGEKKLLYENVTYFAAGSIGRQEAGGNSDLDVFVIAGLPELGKLQKIRLLAKVADVNDELQLPPFSDEMRYMKVYDSDQIINDTGKPRDDSENSFTTRMLLLLESTPLANDAFYASVAQRVCLNYFRDNKGKKDFRPLFLINDLLRYWRTLCLNYEQCREDPAKPWRKKNVNLRFSRLTTVFSTIALLMIDRPADANAFFKYLAMPPLERLAIAVDKVGDSNLIKGYGTLLDHYATFLRVKDSANPEKLLEKGDIKQKMRDSAQFISDFFAKLFDHESIRDHARYLLL